MRGGADLGKNFFFFLGPILFFFLDGLINFRRISGKYLVDFLFYFIALIF